MELTQEKFDQRKAEAKAFYDTVGTVKCPYFNNEEIHFNAEGFEHIRTKDWNRSRSQLEQYTRFRLLPLVPAILKKSGTLQEYSEKNVMVRQQSSGKWTRRMKFAKYYIFIAIIENLRMKIIVREVDGEKKKFYSVYPSWKRMEDGKAKFYSGDPETD